MRHYGAGPEPTLAVHCMLGHGGAWAAVASELDDLASIAAPDLPGHGTAPRWTGEGDLMEASLAQLEPALDQPRHVIGHSFGAVVALTHTLARPELVLSLTLIEPVLFAAIRADGGAADPRSGLSETRRLCAAGRQTEAAQRFTEEWGTGVRWPDLPREARDRIISQIAIVPDQIPIIEDDSHRLLEGKRLESLEPSTLVVEGDESPPVIREVVQVVASRIPDARIAGVAGAGHMAPLTHPAEVANEIRRHVIAASDTP